MITYSIIQKSQLEGACRIDAEYYQPEFLEIDKYLLSIPHLILGEHAFITDGEHGSVEFVEQGIKYLTAENIQEGFIHTAEPRFVSELVDRRNKRASLLLDDVVISIKGTVGLTAITFEEDLPANMNRDVSRIHTKDSINPFYLVTFLNSKFGRGQTLRESSGNVQQMTTLGRVRELLIPIISKEDSKEVEKLVKNARDELKKNEILYREAEDLLLEELGLKDFQVKEDLSFTVNLSNIKSVNRSDSDFFQPKYDEIIKRLNANRIDSLKTNFEIIKGKGFEYNNDGEVGVIKTKQLGKQFINFEVEDKAQQEMSQKGKLPILIDSDVVFASMGVGSLGKTNIYYLFESEGKYTIDSTLRIFRRRNSGEVLPEVLIVYFNSSVGQELIYKYVVGTSGIISIYEHYLQNFLIPILPKPTQEKIAELVRKSHEARKKSKEFLEEAKRKVEEMIERGGGQN